MGKKSDGGQKTAGGERWRYGGREGRDRGKGKESRTKIMDALKELYFRQRRRNAEESPWKKNTPSAVNNKHHKGKRVSMCQFIFIKGLWGKELSSKLDIPEMRIACRNIEV